MTNDDANLETSASPSNLSSVGKTEGEDSIDETSGEDTTSTDFLMGLDLGTYMSCYLTRLPKSGAEASATFVPTVVGYAEDGILSGILPGNASVLFGDDAIANELHLRMIRPLNDGVVYDHEAASLFLSNLREQVDPKGEMTVRAVIGIPACSDDAAVENLQKAASGAFDGVLFIPEPFLAALGCRDETKLGKPGYVDPASNSLVIDIGAGTTDYCIIQGYFPRSEDQLSIPFGGDEVDEMLSLAIKEAYPETNLPLSMVRTFKEEFSYVGELESGIRVRAPVAGKPCKLEVGKHIGESCNRLLEEIFQSAQKIIGMASAESVFAMLGNVILSGGGSGIRNIGEELERLLKEEGYENPSVTVIDRDSKPLAALGALKVAQGARPDQWIKP
ncbi:MAG: rod shape-determining protein [Opitutales bacterium]|jgi:rod shape-determining protein MreB and related proteins